MPRVKKLKALLIQPNNPATELTLLEAHGLRRQYNLSSLLTRPDGAWRLFYSHECNAGYLDAQSRHDQEFEDELQANQYFHQLRSEWLSETPTTAG